VVRHAIWLDRQAVWQTPLEQSSLASHASPQAPQLALVFRRVQLPLQQASPIAQRTPLHNWPTGVHLPHRHDWPGPQQTPKSQQAWVTGQQVVPPQQLLPLGQQLPPQRNLPAGHGLQAP
jgi:hypothetical protein